MKLWRVSIEVRQRKTGERFTLFFMAIGNDEAEAKENVLGESDLSGVDLLSFDVVPFENKAINIGAIRAKIERLE
jgi:hypothetical protein